MVSKPIVITCGGGKGGIGKSTMISNLGTILAQKGFTVGFVDADLGGANLHVCLGVQRPKHTLADFLCGRVKDLSECLEKTSVPRSWLIGGASGVSQVANPLYSQKQKLIRNIQKLNADFILIDLGAGSHSHVADFFASYNYNIVVIDSLPTSVENAYGFLKNGILRALLQQVPATSELRDHINRFSDPYKTNSYVTLTEMINSCSGLFPEEITRLKQFLAARKIFLVINMVKTTHDVAIGKHFIDVVKKYLDQAPHYLGYCIYEPKIRQSIRDGKPIVLDNPPHHIANCLDSIANNLLALTKG